MPLWQIYIAGNNSIHLGFHVKCTVFLHGFNQIWSLTYFHKNPQYLISIKSVRWQLQSHMWTDRETDMTDRHYRHDRETDTTDMTERQTDRHDRQTLQRDRHDRQTDRHDRQTLQTDRHDRQRDRQT